MIKCFICEIFIDFYNPVKAISKLAFLPLYRPATDSSDTRFEFDMKFRLK